MIWLDPSLCRYEQTTQSFYYIAPWSGQWHRCRGWNAGCRPEALQNHVWRYAPDELVLPLLSPDLAWYDAQHPATLYAAQIPQEIASTVSNYEIDQMIMLHLCASSERAVQLLRHSPNFLWLIGPFVVQASRGKAESMHDLFGYSQKNLIAMAFGMGTQGMVNMLKKLPVGSITDERHAFFQVLSDETCSDVLRHRQECQWPLFKIMTRYRDRLQDPCIRRMFAEDLSLAELLNGLQNAGEIYRDTVRLGRALRIDKADRIISSCQSWSVLRLLHETWTRRMNNERAAQRQARLAKPFPVPPVPGTPGILPIDTESKLLAEGRSMHHCAGAYVSEVRAGASYIYQVLEPERATLELRLVRNGEWRIAQIKSYCNAAVSSNTRKVLQRWLMEAQRANLIPVPD